MFPGFTDPVRDSQAVFRTVLNAMARPGVAHTVTALDNPPYPLGRAAAAVLLTLVDGDTSLWIDEQARAAHEWIAFHCGAGHSDPTRAHFAVTVDPIPLDRFCVGTDDEPESSTTLIFQVEALGAGPAFRLEGPGLAQPVEISISGLGDQFIDDWQFNRRLFPRGIDAILCAGDRLVALPRTVQCRLA